MLPTETINKHVLADIAHVCFVHPEKRKQLEKVQEISCHLTSDDGIHIEWESYDRCISRILIRGTRSCMTITYDWRTLELTRKKRGEKPYRTYTLYNRNCYEILNKVREYEKLREEAEAIEKESK